MDLPDIIMRGFDMLHYGMTSGNRSVEQLRKLYLLKKKEIISRLADFERSWDRMSEEEIFIELSFCLLTPQSRAKACWDAIGVLTREGLLLKGSVARIREKLHCVRFHNKKAEYLVDARNIFTENGRIGV